MKGNSTTSSKKKVGERAGLPSPREMIAHYESKGMGSQEASLKVIEDLQNALFRGLVLEKKKMKKAGVGGGDSTSRSQKLDVINSRLINLDMKVDSKPGYPQTLAIGLPQVLFFVELGLLSLILRPLSSTSGILLVLVLVAVNYYVINVIRKQYGFGSDSIGIRIIHALI